MDSATNEKKSLADLVAVMAELRTPGTGCPWDLAQTFETIAPYTIEEAYEVADAIARGDRVDLEEELGDLLLQVVYHARLAEEEQAFQVADVIDTITRKMIRRHPHVFGSPEERAAGAAPGFWERIKEQEREAKAEKRRRQRQSTMASSSPLHNAQATPLPSPRAASTSIGDGTQFGDNEQTVGGNKTGEHEQSGDMPSVLENVPLALPALSRAIKLQSKAARVGFDWPSLGPVFDKMREELGELEETLCEREDAPAQATAHQQEEFGDLLFVMANVARHLKIDAEDALRQANAKFTRRFQAIEAALAAQGRSPKDSNLEEMDKLWDQAKLAEK